MYLREKTLQERQQTLVLEFHGKRITRLLIVVFICWHQRRKRKLLINQYDHRLEVYALHVIIQSSCIIRSASLRISYTPYAVTKLV